LVSTGEAWAGGKIQDDDVTFVVFKVKRSRSELLNSGICVCVLTGWPRYHRFGASACRRYGTLPPISFAQVCQRLFDTAKS
jgi:hypothetical protein